ncbi:MAG: hypothetical protein HQ518_01530 [Rhodopirellula sp.]|nr:hypothetical protein [Rhodopirellula sp.]
MTDNDLNRAVARATGETISEIRSRGFSALAPLPSEPEPHPRDWTVHSNHDNSLPPIDSRSPLFGSTA